jgi:hypothetical protein
MSAASITMRKSGVLVARSCGKPYFARLRVAAAKRPGRLTTPRRQGSDNF